MTFTFLAHAQSISMRLEAVEKILGTAMLIGARSLDNLLRTFAPNSDGSRTLPEKETFFP
jgi:hypothetical protein